MFDVYINLILKSTSIGLKLDYKNEGDYNTTMLINLPIQQKKIHTHKTFLVINVFGQAMFPLCIFFFWQCLSRNITTKSGSKPRRSHPNRLLINRIIWLFAWWSGEIPESVARSKVTLLQSIYFSREPINVPTLESGRLNK